MLGAVSLSEFMKTLRTYALSLNFFEWPKQIRRNISFL